MMHNEEYKIIKEDIERLREEVMSRVKTVRRLRAVLTSPYSSAVLAIICLLSASIFISVGDVVHNIMAQGEWGGRLSYTYSSILHTGIIVQIIAGLMSLSCLALFLKILLKLRSPMYFLGHFISSRSPKLFRS
jgi:hypothetical protein